jgi:hypothetical protein
MGNAMVLQPYFFFFCQSHGALSFGVLSQVALYQMDFIAYVPDTCHSYFL